MHSPSMGLVTKVTQVSSKEDKMFVKNFSQQYLPDLNLNTAGGAISSHQAATTKKFINTSDGSSMDALSPKNSTFLKKKDVVKKRKFE